MKLKYFKKTMEFIVPAGTSRGVLREKPSWVFYFEENRELLGECSVIPGLSPDYENDEQYETKLSWVCSVFNELILDKSQQLVLAYFCSELRGFPSVLFGLETLLYNWNREQNKDVFESAFSKGKKGIPINGLVWMGREESMRAQIEEKISEGYRVIKLKIGAIDIEKEITLLKEIRKHYGQEIEIRVDANGAFDPNEAEEVLLRLGELDVHSIEQPIGAGQHEAMSILCEKQIVPIALDEELIRVYDVHKKKELLARILPQYIILKPSLHGGLKGCMEWIDIAESMNIAWWLTSALESNIGLEMIARFSGAFDPLIPQGLGTGSLFKSNVPTSMFISDGQLFLQHEKER